MENKKKKKKNGRRAGEPAAAVENRQRRNGGGCSPEEVELPGIDDEVLGEHGDGDGDWTAAEVVDGVVVDRRRRVGSGAGERHRDVMPSSTGIFTSVNSRVEFAVAAAEHVKRFGAVGASSSPSSSSARMTSSRMAVGLGDEVFAMLTSAPASTSCAVKKRTMTSLASAAGEASRLWNSSVSRGRGCCGSAARSRYRLPRRCPCAAKRRRGTATGFWKRLTIWPVHDRMPAVLRLFRNPTFSN